jgi:succinoglycan biosynthesis transport protein ExoP
MVLTEKSPTQRVAPAGAPAPQPLELWGGPAGSPLAKMPDIRAFLPFLRRNAVWIAAVAVPVALACFVLVRLIFNQYSATATVLFDPRNAKVTTTQEVLSDIGPDSIAIESLVQVAKSDGFLTALVARLGLADDSEFGGSATAVVDRNAAALDKLRDRLAIGRRGATYVVDLSAKSADAQKAARIANAAADMMVENESNLRSGLNQHAADQIASKLEQLRERVSSEDSAIAKLRTDLKITDAGQGEALQERRVTELNQQYTLAIARTGEARALVDQLREANLAAASALPTAIQSPVLSVLREDYVRLTRQAADRETVLGARHPDVIATKAQLDDLRRQIAAEKDRLIASAKADYLEARKREAAAADELHKAQADSGATDQSAVQLRDLERSAKSDQAVYEQLLARQKELTEIKGLTTEDIRVVSQAIAPMRTNMPKLLLVLAASLFVGLFAGLASAVVREGMGRPQAAPPAAGPPPAFRPNAIVPLLSPSPPLDGRLAKGEATRWFAGICGLPPMRRIERGGLVLVTSAQAGEGKSTVAANIAAFMAMRGGDVLLMQLTASEAVAARRGLGLLDVVAGECRLDEALLWFGEEAPSILPLGGSAHATAAEIEAVLTGPALLRLIHECRRSFDTLVIDAMPILETPALRALVKLADATLVVAEWNKTKGALVDKALEGLDPGKVGLVLNKVDPASHGAIEPLMGDRAPVARERHASASAEPAESKARMRRRRSAADRAR